MKKSALLNSELSYVIAKMGHTDTLTVGDCGLPIPQETQRIDLALRKVEVNLIRLEQIIVG